MVDLAADANVGTQNRVLQSLAEGVHIIGRPSCHQHHPWPCLDPGLVGFLGIEMSKLYQLFV